MRTQSSDTQHPGKCQEDPAKHMEVRDRIPKANWLAESQKSRFINRRVIKEDTSMNLWVSPCMYKHVHEYLNTHIVRHT